MRLTKLNKIETFKGSRLFLPNSVDILGSGQIIICDGGNDIYSALQEMGLFDL